MEKLVSKLFYWHKTLGSFFNNFIFYVKSEFLLYEFQSVYFNSSRKIV